ncbi:helix-turn-helix transcriptional regulator [Paractinoplanes hotanensis]|uniref:AAA family ATPase n=1 Tax=Paractinoplanes hotanensis TaxID=2906497 RepID=A0ABT0XRJ6_9ACTN|nr:LuxR family transcriptional regulator [Actinoplanes hotanensis]MCM4076362.1 AAA family ATPase [Actinoplanes hotanensis]
MTRRRLALVGRESELAATRRAFEEIAEGRAWTLCLRGEPGIGKSRLLIELGERAREHSMLLLVGRAAELERDLPFALLADTFDGASVEITRALAGLQHDDVEQLASALPAFRRHGHGSPALWTERHRVAGAVRTLLELLAAHGQPVVLLLDDVHWADPATVDVLALLLHRPPRGPVLLALATRAGLTDTVALALAQAVRDGRGELRDLQPLSAEDVARLLPDLPGGVRDRLYRESGGNPFYLEELARGFAGRPTPAWGDLLGIPRVVRAALAGEVRHLSTGARLVLEGGAVAGDPFDLELAAAAADLGEADVLAGLDALLAADLLRPTGRPRRFRFRHPLVRRSVYEDSAGGWRIAAHARVAEALRALGATPARRAHHVERSARPGQLTAISELVEAAEEAAAAAPATAAGWYEAALRLLPDDAEHHERRLSLLRAQGGALASAGRPAHARDVLRRLLRLMTAGAGRARVEVVEQLAQLEGMWTGNTADADRLLEQERAALGAGTSWEAAVLTLAVARNHGTSGEHTTALVLAEEAAALARAAGDSVLEADAACEAADAAHCAQRSADPAGRAAADERILRAAALVDALTEDQVAERLQMLLWLGVARAFTGDLTGAVADGDRGLVLARRTRQGLLAPSFLILRGYADEELGRLDACQVAAEEVLDNAIVSNNPQLGLWGAMVASRIALIQGRIDAALRHGEAAWAFCGVDPGSAAGWTLADARLSAGDLDGATAALDAFGWVGPGLWTRDRVRATDVGVRVLLALGQVEKASDLAARAPAEAGGRCSGTFAGMMARIDASVALARGDAATAARVALSGAHAADAAGTPLWAGHCRILAGAALAERGRADEARRHLHDADRDLRALGAHGIRDGALAALRRLGDRPRVPTKPPDLGNDRLAALTVREREIAELVGAGHTNAGIARRLHLSERTVEKHVSSVLAKLGLRSRNAVGRLLAAQPRTVHPPR